MKASIVIPVCRKNLPLLKFSVLSAQCQSHQDTEIIIVGDGVSRGDIFRADPSFERLTVLHQPILGPSAARNRGIRACTGDYVLCLDSDDLISPYFIEKTIGKEDICGTWWQEIGENDRIFRPHPWLKYENLIKKNQIVVTCLMKKSVWEDLNGFDESMKMGLEDWDFWLRAAKKGYCIKVLTEILFYYRKQKGETHNKLAFKNYSEIVQYMRTKKILP